jgi:hypothetical protein
VRGDVTLLAVKVHFVKNCDSFILSTLAAPVNVFLSF